MQAPDGSSVGARAALLRLSIDLRLHPSVVATALEYTFDNHASFPSASHALCCSIVSQGYCVDTQILHVALQKLRRNFGGMSKTMVKGPRKGLTIERCLWRASCAAALRGTVADAVLRTRVQTEREQCAGFVGD